MEKNELELKVNEMEQVSGGNFVSDLGEVLQGISEGKPTRVGSPNPPETWTGRGKC